MPLTEMRIRSAKPTDRVQKLSDGSGLFLQVETRGSKLWRFSYRYGGRQKTLSMGRYPEVGLGEARRRRDAAREQLAMGIDPSADRRAAKAALAAPPAAVPTWREVAEEYARKSQDEGRAEATLSKLRWLLDMTYPDLGARPIGEITAPELLAVLRRQEAEGHYETAKRLRSLCGRVFRHGIATGRCERDVAADLAGALISRRSTPHAAILEPAKLGQLLRAIRGYDGDQVIRAGLLLLAYTFLRPGEVRRLEWADVDLTERRIVIPEHRMKMRRKHIVPLARQVVDLLEELQPLTARKTLVLPGLRGSGRPLSENTFNAALRAMGYAGDTMVAHGFRRTASTLLNEMNWNPDWIERQLAHVERNNIRRTYNAAEWLGDRARMMQAWADYLDVCRGSSTEPTNTLSRQRARGLG